MVYYPSDNPDMIIGHRTGSGSFPESHRLSDTTKNGFVETLSFQQIVKHLFTEGTVPVPPNRPFTLRWCRITFSGVIAPDGCHSGGAEALHAGVPKQR